MQVNLRLHYTPMKLRRAKEAYRIILFATKIFFCKFSFVAESLSVVVILISSEFVKS